ncbi:hypothetical protein ACMYSO_02760 [Klebsiella sp. B345]|uniref:hypothetical protein n=1 Tax=Klebsiella sp. B345 TaxID=2755398 RepID=UPI003DA8A608
MAHKTLKRYLSPMAKVTGDFLHSAFYPVGGEIVESSLEYACKRIMELEPLLLVEGAETVWPAEVAKTPLASKG